MVSCFCWKLIFLYYLFLLDITHFDTMFLNHETLPNPTTFYDLVQFGFNSLVLNFFKTLGTVCFVIFSKKKINLNRDHPYYLTLKLHRDRLGKTLIMCARVLQLKYSQFYWKFIRLLTLKNFDQSLSDSNGWTEILSYQKIYILFFFKSTISLSGQLDPKEAIWGPEINCGTDLKWFKI